MARQPPLLQQQAQLPTPPAAELAAPAAAAAAAAAVAADWACCFGSCWPSELLVVAQAMQDPAAALLCWHGTQLLPLLQVAVLAGPFLQDCRHNLLQGTAVLAWAPQGLRQGQPLAPQQQLAPLLELLLAVLPPVRQAPLPVLPLAAQQEQQQGQQQAQAGALAQPQEQQQGQQQKQAGALAQPQEQQQGQQQAQAGALAQPQEQQQALLQVLAPCGCRRALALVLVLLLSTAPKDLHLLLALLWRQRPSCRHCSRP
jgi:hypothetical protein